MGPLITRSRLPVAGPSVLHIHISSAQGFRRKYTAIADAPPTEGTRPFDPSAVEAATLDLIRSSRASGADSVTVDQRLDELHRQVTAFSATEIDLLETAGLILTPDLAHSPEIG